MPPELDQSQSNNTGVDTSVADKAAADKAAADKVVADKAVADKAAADKVVADKAAADKVAPEKYEAFAAPEGVTLDKEVVTTFEGVAKELGLPQASAQKLIDKISPVMAARQAAANTQVREEMLAASKADPEIGGEKFNASVETAKLAISTYFAPEFEKFLNDTGLGNHPEMIRGLVKAGAPLKQDGHIVGGKQPAGGGDARSFYPNSKMEA